MEQVTVPGCERPTVQLSGNDGNAFAVIGACVKALKRAKYPAEKITAFRDEATSGDYDNLLRVCMRWLDVE